MQKIAILWSNLLFLSVTQQQCLSGFRRSLTGLCARVNLAAGDIFAAQDACEAFSKGGQLVSIHSAYDNQFLLVLAQETALTHSLMAKFRPLAKNDTKSSVYVVYIGLIDVEQNGNFEWIDGSALDFQNWCPGYPSKFNANDNCVIINVASSNCWRNTNCNGRFASLCEQTGDFSSNALTSTTTSATTHIVADQCNPGFTLMEDGHCYYASNNSNSFENAETFCQAMGAHLVSMHSYWENVIALNFAQRLNVLGSTDPFPYNIWIGLICHNSSISSCLWTDGSRFDYSAMIEDIPRLSNEGNRGVMYPGRSSSPSRGRWSTVVPNRDKKMFICKHRSRVEIPETSDDQLPHCNIGYSTVNGSSFCYLFHILSAYAINGLDSFCLRDGGRCAAIQSEKDNKDICTAFRANQPFPHPGFFLGLKENNNTWQWQDGTPFSYSNWDIGFPRQGEVPFTTVDNNCKWQTQNLMFVRQASCKHPRLNQVQNDVCPVNTYFGMGEIRSPGYPNNYAANIICTYTLHDTLRTDPGAYLLGTKLAVYFIAFKTHPSDVVEIYDGADTNSQLNASISGIAGAQQEYYSTGYNMTIRFKSTVGNNYKGWRAVFGPYTTKP